MYNTDEASGRSPAAVTDTARNQPHAVLCLDGASPTPAHRTMNPESGKTGREQRRRQESDTADRSHCSQP